MKKNISRKKLREFGLLLGFTIPFLFGFLLPAFSAHVFKIWTIWAGVVFLTFSVVNPNLLLYPYRVWMFIGYFLGLINSRIILGVVFLVVLLPISFFMKLFGYDPLRKNKFINKNTFKEVKVGHKIDLTKIF